MTISRKLKLAGVSLMALTTAFLAVPAQADIVHADDVIISAAGGSGNLCVGSDCVDMMPFVANIQIKTDKPVADILLEAVDGLGDPVAKWGIIASASDINFTDLISFETPFEVSAGAPSASFFITPTGSIGMGTFSPDGNLDVDGGAADATILLTNTSAKWELKSKATTGRLNFKNLIAGGVPFKLGPASVNGLLSVGTSTADLVEVRGDLDVTGILTTGGPTCGGGCDAVFDADYDLPSIEEHAKAMYANKHLPAVGPTIPRAPINISEQYGKVLNELEKAHIYIAQVNAEKDALEVKVEELAAKFSALEDRLEQ